MDNDTLHKLDYDSKDDLWFQQISNNVYTNNPYMKHYNKRIGKACAKTAVHLNNELPRNTHSKIHVAKMMLRLQQKLEERKQKREQNK